MSNPEAFQLSLGPLTGVAFGPDRTEVAISPNNNEVQIYKKNGDTWDLKQTLSEHDKLITAISWAPQTNRIVTCSQDRNAYVWTQTPQGWKPALVLLRINRAATCVKWSPKEDKFAVGSGARTIAVCSFDEENNWWVSKHIKKPLRSTVLSIDWHPNNVLLAAGTAESKAYVFSAFIKGIDAKPEPTVSGDRLPFGTICGEFHSSAGGWVHDVAFSPSGDVLGFVAHDSSVNLVYPSSPGNPPQAFISIRTPGLPYISLTFVSESSLIAAGHDCQPVLYTGDESGWTLSASLDSKSAGGTAGGRVVSGSGAGAGRLNTEAFNMFKKADTMGQNRSASSSGGGTTGGIEVGADGMLLTVHQNSITHVEAYEWGSGGAVSKVVTAGKDGRLVIWNVAGKRTCECGAVPDGTPQSEDPFVYYISFANDGSTSPTSALLTMGKDHSNTKLSKKEKAAAKKEEAAARRAQEAGGKGGKKGAPLTALQVNAGQGEAAGSGGGKGKDGSA